MRRLCPRRLGSLVQANARRLAVCSTLALLALCTAINSARFDSELVNWIQRTWRVESELQAINSAIGKGAGVNNLLVFQVPREEQSALAPNTGNNNNNKHKLSAAQNNFEVLSVESLMIHLEALAIATHVTVDLYDISWSLKDLCYSPTPPDYEGLLVNNMLEHLMPCVIKTPLDCFWEGAKLLGPEQDIRLSSIGPKLKWTSLNPRLMVELKQLDHPHASFPYATLLDWMDRVGITSGYVEKPCLDPSDPNCPMTAPNKQSGVPPNVGHQLTGGCHGLASKQMHWKEDEILGGVKRNKSGQMIGVDALQTTIQLMGEQDIYEYWRKTSKVQDIESWSSEKAKQVLDMWQQRYKEELDQFARTSIAADSFKLYAMTPKSMLEPIDVDAVNEFTNFKLALSLMTLVTCIIYPRFGVAPNESKAQAQAHANLQVPIDRIKILLLAIINSLIIGLTFIASLGLSSFMNLPFNMATTQILPPIALYYGFKQSLMIANIYSRQYNRVPLEDLTTECLNELLPETLMESIIWIIPLTIASLIPVPATRVFTCQAIAYVSLATMTSILLIPSLLTAFLVYINNTHKHELASHPTDDDRAVKSRCESRSSRHSGRLSAKPGYNTDEEAEDDLDEEIFSRLQDDLKYVKADSPSNFNLSAHFGPDGLRTNLSLTGTSIRLTANSPGRNGHHRQQQQQQQQQETFMLPDLLQDVGGDASVFSEKSNKLDTIVNDSDHQKSDAEHHDKKLDLLATVQQEERKKSTCLAFYTELILKNQLLQVILLILRSALFVLIVMQCSKVEYGLQLKDIITRGTADYESLLIQEEYFPIYNIFIVTKGNFDYASNQRLLYEFQKRIERVDGVIQDTKPKFWLTFFRDWLIDLQAKFDLERNRSAISKDGWTSSASDASKLAFKLLAQTGRADNPIDKNQVESTRLVDRDGIINEKAFYYYLTAWVMNDAFSYSSSEANFKPEPKTWNDNPDDLRIERARPLVYTQIPFLLKLSQGRDTLKTITEIRSISQAFEQLNLPNFPTGVPFTFWDQFLNLNLLFIAAIAIMIVSLYLVIATITSDLIIATLVAAPILTTSAELYGVLGLLKIPFNDIIGVLMISTSGIMAGQTMHHVLCLKNIEGDMIGRLSDTLKRRSRIVLSSSILFFICVIVLRHSMLDFMIRFAYLLFCLAAIILLNTIAITPILLRMIRPEQTRTITAKPRSSHRKRITQSREPKPRLYKKRDKKRRGFPRVKSEISLSTISEESHSEARAPAELKFDISIVIDQ